MAQTLEIPEVSINTIREWTNEKMNSISNNGLLTLCNKTNEEMKDVNVLKSNHYFRQKFLQLHKLLVEDIKTAQLFREIVSKALDSNTQNNKGDLIDLNLKLINLEYQMISKNERGFEHFLPQKNLYTIDEWSKQQEHCNSVTESFIARWGIITNHVGSVQSKELQTIISMKSSIAFDPAGNKIQYLTMNYSHSNCIEKNDKQ